MKETKLQAKGTRILARQLGRDLTAGEISRVAGTGTDDHGGTCTNEQDCDANLV